MAVCRLSFKCIGYPEIRFGSISYTRQHCDGLSSSHRCVALERCKLIGQGTLERRTCLTAREIGGKHRHVGYDGLEAIMRFCRSARFQCRSDAASTPGASQRSAVVYGSQAACMKGSQYVAEVECTPTQSAGDNGAGESARRVRRSVSVASRRT